jgi:GT2 family glycosyltransferase
MPLSELGIKVIGIIMVTYGRSELLDQTLKSLFENTEDVNLCIIDNGSKQPVIDVILKYVKDINFVQLLGTNKGKPFAWNIGAKHWDNYCYISHYLFCDSDVEFKPNWQTNMLSAYNEFYKDDMGILSGYCFNDKGQVLEKNGHKILKKRFPAGCCMLMHRNVYESVGEFDESVKIGTVDTKYITEALKCRWWAANVVPTAIEHIGQKMRTFEWDNTAKRVSQILYYE